jgi:hypothetical protein
MVANLDICFHSGRLTATRGVGTTVKRVIRPVLIGGIAGVIIIAGPPLLLTKAAKKQKAY